MTLWELYHPTLIPYEEYTNEAVAGLLTSRDELHQVLYNEQCKNSFRVLPIDNA